MYSLSKFASRTGATGLPLPDPYPSLALGRATFRKSGTSMIAGQPGAFKSILALNILAIWARAGVSALYFAADSDEFTVAKRLGAILTGTPEPQVEGELLTGRSARYAEALAALDGIRWEYRPYDMDGIASRAASYAEVYGAYPDVIFIDNLMNFTDSGDEWALMRSMMRDLNLLATETRTHICVLHHAGEDYPSHVPPPRKAIQGKISQIPRLILTTAADDLALRVAVVKNTNGPQDPSGRRHMQFMVHESLQVEDVGYQMEVS